MLTIFLLSISLLFVFVLLILLWLYDRRRNTIVRQEAKNRELNQTYLQSKLEIREQTIKDIREELHNNMGQMASLIKICLNNVPYQERDKTDAKIEETREITQQLINDIKSLSQNLSEEHFTFSGLDKALEEEAERLNKSGRVKVTISQQGNFPVIDQVKAVILFRISQEILHFRIKQGKAKHLSILIQELENELILSFNDDGIVAEKNLSHKYTAGSLSELEKKTKLINAKGFMESTPPETNGIRIEMPL